MSYDVYITCDRPCPHCTGEWMNITYNVGAMWAEANIENAPSIKSLDGMTTKDASRIVFEVIHQMRIDPHRFKDKENKDGWGTYPQFMAWLIRFHNALLQTKGKVRV